MSIAELITSTPKSQAAQHPYLDDLQRTLGADSWLTRNELGYLFGRSFESWLANMESSNKIAATGVKLFDERHPQWRYSLSEIVQHIRDSETPVQVEQTPIGLAVIDGTPAEAIDPTKDYTVEQIEQLFGIPPEKLDGKKLSMVSHPFKPFAVNGAKLIEWIESDNIKTVWSINTAARIVRHRRDAGEQLELSKQPKPKPSLIDTTFEHIDQIEQAEQTKRAESRAASLKSYRLILARRAKPKADDAAALAELCRELNYDRDHVAADIRALDSIVEWEAIAKTADVAYAELNTASDELSALQKRVKAELIAANDRCQRARSAVRRVQAAPGEIAETKRRHPELIAE